ncbi:hypothetical protein TNCV_2526561 [Trichonephila clavipes]|nr:hypothetical protein TNCV_2526561 [Trichonephila clavipes]
MPYSGFEPQPSRLQAEYHNHHTGWGGSVEGDGRICETAVVNARNERQFNKKEKGSISNIRGSDMSVQYGCKAPQFNVARYINEEDISVSCRECYIPLTAAYWLLQYCHTNNLLQVPIAELAERWTELPQVSDESRSFFRVHTGYFSNIPKCIKAEFIASWGCSQSSVVSSSQR